MAAGTVLRALILQSPGISIEVPTVPACQVHAPVQVFTISCHVCSILNGISNIVVSNCAFHMVGLTAI